MKRLLSLSVVSFLLLLGISKSVTAQESPLRSLCFSDGFGFVYTFPSLSHTGPGTYTGTGTSSAYPSTATIKIVLSSPSSGTLQMKVVNDAPDGCTNFTDGYTYSGSISVSHSGGHPSGTGSGTWASYCFGSVLFTGTWTASGPCSSPALKPTGITPASGSKKINDASRQRISIIPNPVVNHTQLTYTLANAGKVNITIYNAMQQPVKVLVNQMQSAGKYSVSWNTLNSAGTAVSNGIYKVVAVMGNEVYTSSIQVVR